MMTQERRTGLGGVERDSFGANQVHLMMVAERVDEITAGIVRVVQRHQDDPTR